MRNRPLPAKSLCLGLLLALTLVRGLIYAAVIPPWQAPDETGHFEYAWLIAKLKRLPDRQDASPAFERELIGSLYEWRFGESIGRPLPEAMPARLEDLPSGIWARHSRTVLEGRFSLSYLWQALFLIPVQFQEISFQLYVARLSSILINVAIVWVAFKTFHEMMPTHHFLVCAMASAVVFLPQHTFVNSMVGDGPLAELMACLVLYCWVRLFRQGLNIWRVLGILCGTVVGVWSKATAAYLIPLNIGLAVWWFYRQPRRGQERRRAALVFIALALLGVVLWMRFSPLSGPVTQIDVPESLTTAAPTWQDERGITLGQALLLSHDSFWANFGWMAVPVGPRWYGGLLLLTVAALCGWLFGGPHRQEFPRWAAIVMAAAFGTALVIFVWVALLFPSSGYYQFQGRYLFAAIVPFAFLLVGGWSGLIQPRWRPALIGTGVMLLALFDVWCVLGYVVPYFYA